MPKIYTELETSYIPDLDITVVWQNMYMYVEGVGDDFLQRALIGWYHGRPDEHATATYGINALIANYVDCEN